MSDHTEEKICEDRNLGLTPVKWGKNLRVHQKGTSGPTDVEKDFFDHENSSADWYGKGTKVRAVSSPKDKREVWVVKGKEKNPEGIGLHIQVDLENGKFVFKGREIDKED